MRNPVAVFLYHMKCGVYFVYDIRCFYRTPNTKKPSNTHRKLYTKIGVYLMYMPPYKMDFAQPPKPNCPYCDKNSKVIKIGYRKTKSAKIPRYKCNACNRTFVERAIKHATYPPKIILTAISTYNLGHTKKETAQILARNHKIRVPISTIHSWLKRYEHICTFTGTLRKRYKIDPETVIFSKKFNHQQVYTFKYHTLKLNIAGKSFPNLKNYLQNIPKKCPDEVFQSGPRCSELRIDIKPRKITKHNNAPKLAELAIILAKTNRERHEKVEDFMLINDSATIAVEVPVYLYPDEMPRPSGRGASDGKTIAPLFQEVGPISEPLSGHIDLIQVRFNRIHVLDYKPDARKTDRKAAEQVFLYALALSKRTNIPLNKFTCAYFDEKNYYSKR